MKTALLAIAALVGAAGGGGAVWALGGGGTPAVERTVHAYLIAHPEVITEAMGRLQDRDTAKTVADNRAAITAPIGDAWAGDPHGDVTLVEYYDYNCGYCRASLPVIAELLAAEPHVRLIYRELPVLAESSRAAARVSLLAARQGRFRRFHDALYAAGPVSDDTIAATARAAGVDLSKLPAATAGEDGELHANLHLAQQLGMAGTPSWVIGDRVVVGALTLDRLRQEIADARAKARSG